MKDLLQYSEHRLHRQVRSAEKYTAQDVWNYFRISWMGKGRSSAASFTTRERMEAERQLLLSRVEPPEPEALEKFERWAERWGLDTVLYAVDDAVSDSMMEPTLDDVREHLSMAYGELRRRLLSMGVRKNGR